MFDFQHAMIFAGGVTAFVLLLRIWLELDWMAIFIVLCFASAILLLGLLVWCLVADLLGLQRRAPVQNGKNDVRPVNSGLDVVDFNLGYPASLYLLVRV